MVEDVEVLCANTEVKALGQLETPPHGEIGLVYGIWAPQTVPWEISNLPGGG
jgi:hypothetical protein